MDYAMVSKIEKAKRYAEQPDRIEFTDFSVKVKGENSVHTVTYKDGVWSCTCSFFQSRGCCSHTMAMERVLGQMIPTKSSEEAVVAE